MNKKNKKGQSLDILFLLFTSMLVLIVITVGGLILLSESEEFGKFGNLDTYCHCCNSSPCTHTFFDGKQCIISSGAFTNNYPPTKNDSLCALEQLGRIT